MANPEHLKILKQGVEVWNRWREENPEAEPDLSGAYLTDAMLVGAPLTSWWVKDEIRKAQERERREDRDIIIPLMVDRYLLDGWEDGLAADLRSRLAADFTGWEHDNAQFEEQFERVEKALRASESSGATASD